MKYLKIEQNDSAIEQISTSAIEKLYKISKEILDYKKEHPNTVKYYVNLKGRINTSATYQDYIDYLQSKFDGTNDIGPLYITANKVYLRFEDPVVENYFLHTYNSNNGIGDGTGITQADLQSITSLGSQNFLQNISITSLNDLRYFTNVTSIHGRFAREATNLVSVTTPSSLITLSDPQGSDTSFMGAFHGCSKLSNVTLNEGLTTIMCGAFRGCTSLQTIHLPSTVIYLGHATNTDTRKGAQIFASCTTLQTITGGANVIQLGGGTFQDCAQLTSIGDIDLSQVTFIGGDCFFNCQNLELGSVSCTYLTSIPNGGMFYNCKKLTSINLPNVTSIGDAADWRGYGNFRECTALTSVTLSPNLTTIGSYAFNADSALVNISPISPTVIKAFAFARCPFPSTNLDLSNTTEIGQTAFYGCTGLTSIDLSSLTTVGGGQNNGVFQGCTGLTTVTNLNNASGTYMFYGCTGLTNVTLTQNATVIGIATFCACNHLTSIDLSNVTSIGEWAFQNCTTLTNVTSLQNITSVGEYAFDSAPINIELNLPNLTGVIPMGAFYNSGITKVTSLGNTTAIADGASQNNTRAFGNCISMTEFDISGSQIQSIGMASVIGCVSLTTVKLPSTLTNIADWAFCTGKDTIQQRTYYIYATTPPTLASTNSISITNNGQVIMPLAIYVPAGSVSAYQNAPVWSSFASVIQAMPTT